jgi:hypothetical protein
MKSSGVDEQGTDMWPQYGGARQPVNPESSAIHFGVSVNEFAQR